MCGGNRPGYPAAKQQPTVSTCFVKSLLTPKDARKTFRDWCSKICTGRMSFLSPTNSVEAYSITYYNSLLLNYIQWLSVKASTVEVHKNELIALKNSKYFWGQSPLPRLHPLDDGATRWLKTFQDRPFIHNISVCQIDRQTAIFRQQRPRLRIASYV